MKTCVLSLELKKLAALLCLASCFLTQAGEPKGELRAGIRADRVLFLGNSITRHGVLEKIGWSTDWGMAASALEKDYVHLVAGGLAELAGKKPEILIANIADFERSLGAYDIDAKLKTQFEFKPTLAIVAIGENVAALKSDEAKAQFKAGFTKLLAAIQAAGQPAIVVRGCFWTDKTKDDIMREVCAAAGGIFVDIGKLGKDESNFARSERKFSHDGVAAHPGDKGMKGIADAILGAVKAVEKK